MAAQPQDGPALSRYRSVRKQNAAITASSQHNEAVPALPPSAPNASAIERSRSRYRKNIVVESLAQPPALPLRTSSGQPPSPRALDTTTSPHSLPRRYRRDQPDPPLEAPSAGAHNIDHRPRISTDEAVVNQESIHTRPEDNPREQPARESQTIFSSLPTSSAKDQKRTARDLYQRQGESMASEEREAREQMEIARRMREKQRALEAQADRQQSLNQLQHKQRVSSHVPVEKPGGANTYRTRADGSMRQQSLPPEPKSSGQVNAAGVDAPVSSVNAGERQVLVECQHKSIFLPVSNTTTPQDLVHSAATCLSIPINPRASVLMECFGKVGVQRPLRKYERVRDILNSWDDDRQNALTIVPSATGGNDPDLEASSVLKDEPLEFGCLLQYSRKPGKWDKKWVTLRRDGQVTTAKKEGVKAADHTNVCHISDFDIYTPSQKQLTKKIKPPKKICFAIKSQQKSAMFETLESFVHFFCTNDRMIAASFYKAIQGYRSWYLVNVMGVGQKTRDKAAAALGDLTDVGPSEVKHIQPTTHNRGESKDSHYQLGSFKPLLNLDAFNASAPREDTSRNVRISSQSSQTPARAQSHSGPPCAYPKLNLTLDTQQADAHRRATERTFDPAGLLGRTYTQRQKTAEAREQAAQIESPFTPEGLLQTVDPQRIEQPPTSMNLKRAASRRHPNYRPLLDLAEEDLPKPSRPGRGSVPNKVGPGGLIASATTPEVGDATEWRPRAAPDLALKRSSSRIRPQRTTARDDKDDSDWKAADGLLASVSHSQGAQGGRGVMSGVEAAARGRPMIDPRDESDFAAGSLLRRVEEREGVRPPVIDRSKGREVKVGTGEGFV